MNFLRFLISKVFLKNLAIAIVIVLITIFALLKFFDIYTQHGEAITVPDFTGLMYNDLEALGLNKDYTFILNDSLYDDNMLPGSIVEQNPRAGLHVKSGRKVYFTIVAMNPEKVEMPNLVDLTLRQSLSVLETYNLNIGSLQYVNDIAKNAVLQQLYEGEVIEPGTKLIKRTEIDLVLGTGNRYSKVKVPFLYGLTPKQAKRVLLHSSLNVGREVYKDEKNPNLVKVYNQIPTCTTSFYIEMGGNVDLVYRSTLNFDFEMFLKQFEPDTTSSIDSLDMEIMNELNGVTTPNL